MKDIDYLTIWKIFEWGFDYGLLKAEEERESEELFDSFNCSVKARRTGMPSQEAPRRQVHSKNWFKAKQKSFNEFKEFIRNFYIEVENE